jgi:hypothetical protein
MWSKKSQTVAAIVFSATALACADGPPGGPSPEFNYSNGPSNLPNVFRFDGIVGGAAVVDPETDLIAFDGLPDNPADASICGGTEEIANLADFQVNGDLTGVFHLLAQAELNIHVYRLSTFVDICTSVPLAQGTGRLIINDNDAAVSGTRANSFGHRLNGPVTLADGSTAHLAAHSRFLIEPDGTFRQVSSGVTLSREAPTLGSPAAAFGLPLKC